VGHQNDIIAMPDVPKGLLITARVSRLIRYALGDWSMIVAIWLVAPRAPMILYPFWVLLLAGRIHALGVVLHDAVHLPGRKTAAMRALEILAGYPIGSTVEAMRYHHLRHHRDNGFPGDPYFKPWIGDSRARFWLVSLRYFLLLPLWVLRGAYGSIAAYMPVLRNSYGRLFPQDRHGDDLTHSREALLCAYEDRWQLRFHACALSIASANWRWFVAFYVVPAILGGYLAGYRLLVEHTQELNHDRRFLETIRSTRDHHLGFAGWLLLAPHNVGYHRVHHLHPQAALENLPELRNWYAAHYPDIYLA
jgi:fatty acid desaturase